MHESWDEAGHGFHCFTLDLGRDFEEVLEQVCQAALDVAEEAQRPVVDLDPACRLNAAGDRALKGAGSVAGA